MNITPATEAALDVWRAAHLHQQQAALEAFRTAYPLLRVVASPTCCPHQVSSTDNSHGKILVCVGNDSRGTIQLTAAPQQVVGAALDAIFGFGWFDGAPAGLASAGPGTYNWDDDATSAELEVLVTPEGTANLHYGYGMVEDVATLLDRIQAAFLSPQGTEHT